MMGSEEGTLLPKWTVFWYGFNMLILPYDWVYIMMREVTRSSKIARMIFRPLELYAQYDGTFGRDHDPALHAIYCVGTMDMLVQAVIFIQLLSKPNARKIPGIACACLIQLVQLATKTIVFLIYSWPYLHLSYRIPITYMNATWAVVPIILIFNITSAITNALERTSPAGDKKLRQD